MSFLFPNDEISTLPIKETIIDDVHHPMYLMFANTIMIYD